MPGISPGSIACGSDSSVRSIAGGSLRPATDGGVTSKAGWIDVVRDGDGGNNPFWYGTSGNSLELRYGNQFQIFSATITPGQRVEVSRPRGLAKFGELIPHIAGSTPMPGGGYLFIWRGEDEKPVTEANLVLNWFTELERRLREAG